MSGLQINTANERLQADAAIELAARLGYDVSQARPTAAFIRTEQAISASANTYTFPIRVSDPGNATYATQNLLQQQDIFACFSIGMYVTVGAATTYSLKLYTYENATAFSTGGAAAALTTLWQGKLQITVNNIQLVPNWDLYRHYSVPLTQQQSLVTYSGATAITLLDSVDGAVQGQFPVERGIVLNGAANTQFQVTLPGSIGTIQANSRIVFILRGQLLVNVTTVK